MTNRSDYYTAAEDHTATANALLGMAGGIDTTDQVLAVAQVHATLAVAAATLAMSKGV